MKKLIYVLVMLFFMVGCSPKRKTTPYNKDSYITIYACGKDLKLSIDSFNQVKDSFVYCKEEGLWMTKRLYWFNYQCPDSITVAFTRNGKFVDSVVAYRWGILDKNSNSPAYVFYSVMGDAWFYDIKGNFIEFNRSRFPHSGNSYQYKP